MTGLGAGLDRWEQRVNVRPKSVLYSWKDSGITFLYYFILIIFGKYKLQVPHGDCDSYNEIFTVGAQKLCSWLLQGDQSMAARLTYAASASYDHPVNEGQEVPPIPLFGPSLRAHLSHPRQHAVSCPACLS